MDKKLNHFRDLFPVWERIRYLRWFLTRNAAPIKLRMTDGTLISMRPRPLMDHHIVYEVMFQESYALPKTVNTESVRRIVDVGSHVGFSCLYWAKHYPSASIEAFEPHPLHARLLRTHLEMNQLEQRVKLHEAAAATADGTQLFVERDVNSRLAPGTSNGNNGRPVKTVDLFKALGEQPIDILKLDIEGAEYQLLSDARFEKLPVRYLVMEWHRCADFAGSGPEWCQSRLAALGFTVQKDSDPRSQILRAWRDTPEFVH